MALCIKSHFLSSDFYRLIFLFFPVLVFRVLVLLISNTQFASDAYLTLSISPNKTPPNWAVVYFIKQIKYPRYVTKNIIPHTRPMRPVRHVASINITTARIAIQQSNTNAELNGIGKIIPDNPKTNKILNILEPTMLPIAKSDSPLRAAIMLVTNSGRLVPIAIIVNPITRSDIPIYLKSI